MNSIILHSYVKVTIRFVFFKFISKYLKCSKISRLIFLSWLFYIIHTYSRFLIVLVIHTYSRFLIVLVIHTYSRFLIVLVFF